MKPARVLQMATVCATLCVVYAPAAAARVPYTDRHLQGVVDGDPNGPSPDVSNLADFGTLGSMSDHCTALWSNNDFDDGRGPIPVRFSDARQHQAYLNHVRLCKIFLGKYVA